MRCSARLLPHALVVFVVVSLFFASSAAAGLVAHYRLDETSGTTVVDSAGSNDGTLINAPQVTLGATPAPFGTAYTFVPNATVGGGVNLGTHASVQPLDDFTISFWFHTDRHNDFDRFIESMSGTGANAEGFRYDLGSAPGNKVRTLYRNGTGATINLTHSTVVTTGDWYFAAARFESGGQAQLTIVPESAAVNAAAITAATQSTAALAAPLAYNGTWPTMLASANTGGTELPNALRGGMDDVAFFDEVLSDAQLADVFNVGADVIPLATPLPAIGWDASRGPAGGNWNPDVGSGGSWMLTAAPDRVPYANGRRVYRFDGDENVPFTKNGTAASSFSGLGDTNSASFSMLLKPASLAGGKQVLWETGGVNGSSLTLNDAVLRFGTANQGDSPDQREVTHTLASVDEFIHLVGVVDQENGETRMYVDGVEVGAVSAAATISWSGGNAAGLGTIQANATGGFNDAGTAGVGTEEGGTEGFFGTYQGDIAAFDFYQAALSDAHVTELFSEVALDFGAELTSGAALNWDAAQPGPSPTTQWQPTMTDSPATAQLVSFNLTGAADVPTLVADPATAHRISAAYEFHGGEGKAAASPNISGLGGAELDVSFELWIKPDDLTGKEVLWEMGGSGNGSSLRLDEDELIFRAKTSPVTSEVSTTLALGDIDDFIQVVAALQVDTGSGAAMRLFVNGQLVDENTSAGAITSWGGGEGDALGSLNVSQIGGTTAATGGDLETAGFGTFDGQIAIMRYYEGVAMSGPEALVNYNAVAVPEPTGLCLLLVGIAWLACRRRARR